MLISSETCKTLAQIVLTDSNDEASARGPFTVRDRSGDWMVVGPAIEGEDPAIVRRTFYMFIRKIGAEVTGIGYCLDFVVDEDVEAVWRRQATPSMIAAWDQRPEVQPSSVTLDLYCTLHGGLINRPEFAVAYAEAILDSSHEDRQNLTAVEKQGIWHILAATETIFGFTRREGKIVFSP